MQLNEISDRQLADNVRRYREAGKETGGYFSLSELLIEQRRRKPSPFPTVEVARAILELSRKSADGLCTYRDLWDFFCPGKPWVGHGSSTAVANSLARVIAYCVQNGLPVITVLVVKSGGRQLSPQAVQNIYSESRDLGVSVGHDPMAFVLKEREKSRSLVVGDLPQEPAR